MKAVVTTLASLAREDYTAFVSGCESTQRSNCVVDFFSNFDTNPAC